MVGISGSGKTTLTWKAFPKHIHISLDKIKQMPKRATINLQARYDGAEKLDRDRRVEHVMVSDALRHNKNVVIDDTNLTRKVRQRHIRLAGRYAATVNVVFFSNIQKALKQNSLRQEGKLVDAVLLSQATQLEPPIKDEGINYIQVIK